MDFCFIEDELTYNNEISLEMYFTCLFLSLIVLRIIYVYFINLDKYSYETIRYNGNNKLIRINFSKEIVGKNIYIYEFMKFGYFSRNKIRDEVLRILNEIEILSEYDNDKDFLIRQRFVKPKDYFEIYSFLVLKGYSFEINIFDKIYNIEFFNVLNVLKNGPHINLNNFNWEMSFDDNKKIIKTLFFTLEIYLRKNTIEHDVINIRYDVKIIDNPYQIKEKYLYYMAQLI